MSVIETKVETKPKRLKKTVPVKKLISRGIMIAILVAGLVFLYQLFMVEEAQIPLTGEISHGSLATVIEGSGTTRPVNTQVVTVAAAADVEEIFVTAGDMVTEGQLLYIQDDSGVDDIISGYRDEIDEYITTRDGYDDQMDDYQDELDTLKDTLADAKITAPFSGKVTDVSVSVGDRAQTSTKLATLVDDTTMEVVQYFSYAYENDIQIGTKAQVSVAEQMMLLDGEVTKISYVNYVTKEGAQCFGVTVTVANPGSLTSGTEVSAIITKDDGVAIYPAEAGELDYQNQTTLYVSTSADVASVGVVNYQNVTAGQVLFTMETTDIYDSMERVEDNMDSTQSKIDAVNEKISALNEKIAETNENRVDYQPTAEFEGQVISVGVSTTRTPSNNATAVTIYSKDTMQISANIDELDIEHIYMGMPVNITYSSASQTKRYSGEIIEISYEATNSSGVAYFPVVIEIASNGELSAGINVSYSIALGEAEEGTLVPIAALKTTAQGTAVFVKDDGSVTNPLELEDGVVPKGFVAVPVTVSATSSMYALVTETLPEGMEVFTRYETSAPSGGDTTSTNGEEATAGGMQGQGMSADREAMMAAMQSSGGMSSGGPGNRG